MVDSTIKFPVDTSNAADIISPPDSGSTTGFKEYLDGTPLSTDIFKTQETGIWWWCVIHNNITRTNLDIVYPSPTVYFEFQDFKDGLIEYTHQFYDETIPEVTLLSLPETLLVIKLTNPKLPNEDFLLNIRDLTTRVFDPENIITINSPQDIYSISSFRRILDPVHEYLQYKSDIDTIHLEDIKNDLTFAFVLFDKNNQKGTGLNQRIKDVELQIDQLLQIKERLLNTYAIDSVIFEVNRLNLKIAELEASRHKLLDLKEKYDAFNR